MYLKRVIFALIILDNDRIFKGKNHYEKFFLYQEWLKFDKFAFYSQNTFYIHLKFKPIYAKWIDY
jgi:hypothetical protein